jgi:poly-gamma-glutamate capsule biosynthesis protein CapA/YwtB (metallophosphatase superfamily)
MIHSCTPGARHRRARIVLGVLAALAAPPGLAQTCRSPQPPADAEAVTLKAVGDIVLGSDWPAPQYPGGFETRAVQRLRQALGTADVIFGNFEGALTTHGVSTKGNLGSGSMFAFRMPPRFAPLLRDAGFGVLHIANNHTFDFGDTGFRDTLDHLARSGILTVGERDRITFQTVRGTRLAWIGFSYSARHNDMRDDAALVRLVATARREAELVIVSIQAGAEGNEALRVTGGDEVFLGEARGNVFRFARRAVDLGADLVLGHGPHVLRGMECYRGKLIAYSLGNFAGYNALSIKRAAALSAVLEVRLARDRRTLDFDLRPLRFDADRLPEADPDQLARYLVNDLSQLPPLDGSVQMPVPDEGMAAYLEWLAAAGLVRAVGR